MGRGILPGTDPGGGVFPLLYAWWAPGLLVGLALGGALALDPHRALALATATGAIHLGSVGAVVLGEMLLPASGSLPLSPVGAAAGCAAGWLFHAAVHRCFGDGAARSPWIPAGAGALLGGILVHVLTLPDAGRIPVLLASAAWPAVTGSLSCRLATGASRSGEAAPGGMRGRDPAGGRPARIVAATGLAVTIASVLSLLRALP